MSIEQANKYRALAQQYRQKGRTAIAEAMERQAAREEAKGAMDISDMDAAFAGYIDPTEAQKNYIRAKARQKRANDLQQAQPQVQPAQEEQVAPQTGYVPQNPNPPAPPADPPADPPAPPADPPADPPAPPPKYQPSAEELANMIDSQEYNNAIQDGNGLRTPPQVSPIEVPISTGETSPASYDFNLFAGAPANGDMYWNTPAEIRANNERKRRQKIADLMDAANRANL